MQIVDDKQQRLAGRNVRRQPVETVERQERRVCDRVGRELGGVEERRREPRRAREQVGSLLRRQSGKERFEELSHRTVGERALELRASRPQHLQPVLPGPRFRLHHQGGLADSGRPLDREEPAAGRGGGDQGPHRGHLGVAFEEI